MAEPYKGFDELKRQYPSAEYLEMEFPLKGRPMELLSLHQTHAGKINADEFRGHPAKTLWFVGPNAADGRPRATLAFVKRREGWNTAFNPESGSWEEIVHAETGQPPYEAVDFALLGGIIDGNG
jgi:hypothetical protein